MKVCAKAAVYTTIKPNISTLSNKKNAIAIHLDDYVRNYRFMK